MLTLLFDRAIPEISRFRQKNHTLHTEVRFASFFYGEFITAIAVNPPERRLAKRIYEH